MRSRLIQEHQIWASSLNVITHWNIYFNPDICLQTLHSGCSPTDTDVLTVITTAWFASELSASWDAGFTRMLRSSSHSTTGNLKALGAPVPSLLVAPRQGAPARRTVPWGCPTCACGGTGTSSVGSWPRAPADPRTGRSGCGGSAGFW